MGRSRAPVSRAELLPLPSGKGRLGEIFEASILHHTRSAAHGRTIRHYLARAVVLVLEVKGQAEYDDETGRVAPLVPGSCFLIDPRVGHRYGPLPGSHWTEMYLSFRGPIFDSLEESARLMTDPVRHLTPPGAWRKKLREILPPAGGDRHPDLCNGRLIAFLTEAFPPLPVQEEQADSWVPVAKRMLERECATVTEVTERLATTTGLAAETLRKHFRTLTGCSMKAWQMAGKVATARSLLARAGMTQKEIAATLGFSSPQHFSRCMRKATGSTPGNLAKLR